MKKKDSDEIELTNNEAQNPENKKKMTITSFPDPKNQEQAKSNKVGLFCMDL